MKLYLNYGGTDTGTGKIKFSTIHELVLIEEALKHYKEELVKKGPDKNQKISKKISEIEKIIVALEIENAEKLGKKYDSSIGVNLNQFLITRRHKSKILLKELADKLNISPSQYNDIEKENIEAPAEIFIHTLEILKVLENIKIKLYEYIPTIVFYYKDVKFHEVYFDNKEKYLQYKDCILKHIDCENIENVENKIELI